MITEFVEILFDAFSLIFVVYIIMSWFEEARNVSWYGKLESFFAKILKPIRKYLPPLPVAGGGIDLSPIILLLAINWVIRPLILFLLGGH